MSTFLELCRRVRSESGVSSGGPPSVLNQPGMLGRIVTWVQQEWSKLQREQDWTFLWRRETPTLQVGVATYTAAALGVPTLGRILARRLYLVHPTTGARSRIVWAPPPVLDQWPAQAGPPRRFTRDPDGTLRLYTTPDLAYSLVLEHLRRPQVLAANDDVPIIPAEELHEAIVWRALERYARHVGDPVLLSSALQAGSKTLSRLIDLYVQPPDFTPLTMTAIESAEPIYV